MKELKEMLEDKGFKVFCVPEVPTMVIIFINVLIILVIKTMLGGGMIIMQGLTVDAIAKF